MKNSIVLTLTIALLPAAHTAIGSENGIIGGKVDVPSSRQFIEKFNKLVARTQEKPGTIASQLYTQAFKGFQKELHRMFAHAKTSGLMQQYKEILLGTNVNFRNLETFFASLIDPNTLRMMAYMQHTYGHGQANRYYATDTALSDEPIIGNYELSKNETIQITSYGFFDAMLSAIDAVNKAASPNKPEGKAYTARMKQLDQNLDDALAASEAGEDVITTRNITKTSSYGLETEFDAITGKLKELVKRGNSRIITELEKLFDTYK